MMKVGALLGHVSGAVQRVPQAVALGIRSCQLHLGDGALAPGLAAEAREVLSGCGMSVSSCWAGWSGPAVWNFTEGPLTLGLLPPAYRHRRVRELKRSADFAAELGVKQVITHAGFIPENPHDPLYAGMIDAMREVALHLQANGQYFLLETGQETPTTLLRAIEDVGLPNLGVNLDTANLILYGKANPVDALEVIGEYVMDLHVKDGLWPTDGWNLGKEVPVGEGKVDFPAVIRKLKALAYGGALTIEREISGEKQIEDILKAKALLEALLATD